MNVPKLKIKKRYTQILVVKKMLIMLSIRWNTYTDAQIIILYLKINKKKSAG